jgi:Nuclease A inhibitor-like protein
MHKDLEQLAAASRGLLYISESDHPFEVVDLKSNDVEKEIRQLAQKPGDTIMQTQTVDYFFRNMVKTYPGYSEDQRNSAQRFLTLQELIKQKLSGVQVYRIGAIQVDAYIIGKLHDGKYGGLRTKLIET